MVHAVSYDPFEYQVATFDSPAPALIGNGCTNKRAVFAVLMLHHTGVTHSSVATYSTCYL